MLYHLYELNHSVMSPLRAAVNFNRFFLRQDWNILRDTLPGKVTTAALELFDRSIPRYPKPSFGIDVIGFPDYSIGITEELVLRLPFADLLHFCRKRGGPTYPSDDPPVLLVAPLSGHYATLLRGTVEALLPDHDVYVTDWRDAREVSLAVGRFDLDDYIDYMIKFIRQIGNEVHVIAVCQPGPAVVAATSIMASVDDPSTPTTVTLMGSPIDTRMSPTTPNELAMSRSLDWFKHNVILNVPFPNLGMMRPVYPGFLQLTGFMTMNLERHMDAHQKLFLSLVKGDGDSASAHRRFYDEYLAVMDLTAEFYLQTIDVVFQQHALPEGRMLHRGRKVDTSAICNTALMTVEGEKDDISGVGQTQAAHALFHNVVDHRHIEYVQPGAGHYVVFNGSLWRAEIAPRIREFIHSNRH
ncbi:MAG TPA: polyhydroxyalkanoate depolymerase [Gammaproteobacteria bacterium]|nr:polyhydroxyalkanoate depolymerase [Gammaproteobacteria bacterium]|tara:strand:+ start:916 stop:2151 length:1236 start_codon:yes stop_codon:yes gene_type:complete